MTLSFKPLAASFTFLVCSVLVFGQDPQPVQPAGPPVISGATPTASLDKIEPNDRLLVSMFDPATPNDLTVVRRRVDPSGKVDLPNIGAVSVQGKSLAEAEPILAKAWTDKGWDPLTYKLKFVERGDTISITSAPFKVGDHLLLHIGDYWGPHSYETVLLQVGPAGSIWVPQAHDVKILGMTEFEAEKKVDDAFHTSETIIGEQCIIERISPAEAESLATIFTRNPSLNW